jgi:hypothetical protein
MNGRSFHDSVGFRRSHNNRTTRALAAITVVMAILAGCQDDPFAQFRSAVSEQFTPVAEHFALRTRKERKIYPEMYIDFRGPKATITVAHELGSEPWVYVTVRTAGGHERQFGLHTVVEAQKGSETSLHERSKLNDLDAQVSLLADLTRKHAGSLLKERTANLRELYLLSQKALHERERAELGLDRTLSPRPTLPELFQACRPSVHVVCAYHAVVDYNYSTDEVAAFLKIENKDAQRMITQHDTLR